MLKRMVPIVFVLVALLVTGLASRAQGDPPTDLINRALADLSSRAGITITLNDLNSWRWTQSNYPDTSLGCPQAGIGYAQVLTNGYQFVFVYNGATFDYRAAANGSALFLCSGPATVPVATPIPTFTPAQAAATVPAATLEGRAVCTGAMNTRLRTGAQGRVRADGLPVNVRAQATTASQRVTQLNPDETFAVIGGPECAQNYVWWQVRAGDVTGWIAEGANGVYWIEPTGSTTVTITSTPAPAGPAATTPTLPDRVEVYALQTGMPISAATGDQLSLFIDIQIPDAVTDIAWSADGQFLAVTGLSGLRLYDMTLIQQPPRLFQVPSGSTKQAAFNADGSLLATAHQDTIVRVWDTSTGGLRALLRGHMQPIQAVAFSPVAARVASGSGGVDGSEDNTVRLWDVDGRAQIAVLQGHTAPVTAVAFNPDGTLLASGGEDNTVRLWDVTSATPGTVLSTHTAPVRALTFSPDGTWLISGGDDTTIQLWEIGPGTQRTLPGQDTPVTALAITPDGTLLASSGPTALNTDAPMIMLWDLATGTQITAVNSEDTPPDTPVEGMAFNFDGTLLAVATTEDGAGRVRIWGIAP